MLKFKSATEDALCSSGTPLESSWISVLLTKGWNQWPTRSGWLHPCFSMPFLFWLLLFFTVCSITGDIFSLWLLNWEKNIYISLSFHLLKQMKNYSLSAGRILCTENKMFSFRQILKDRNGKTKEVGRQIMNWCENLQFHSASKQLNPPERWETYCQLSPFLIWSEPRTSTQKSHQVILRLGNFWSLPSGVSLI